MHSIDRAGHAEADRDDQTDRGDDQALLDERMPERVDGAIDQL